MPVDTGAQSGSLTRTFRRGAAPDQSARPSADRRGAGYFFRRLPSRIPNGGVNSGAKDDHLFKVL